MAGSKLSDFNVFDVAAKREENENCPEVKIIVRKKRVFIWIDLDLLLSEFGINLMSIIRNFH